MVIVTTFIDDQKTFNRAWCPLMYKHQECQFFISAGPKFVYPKDLKNIHINKVLHNTSEDGPILRCPIEIIPTYRGMVELQSKDKSWVGGPVDLGKIYFYTLENFI